MGRWGVLVLVLGLLGLLGVGCQREGAPSQAGIARRDVLARVGDRVITTQDFQAELNRQSPYFRRQYATYKQKMSFLRTLIQFEVLVLEARRHGLQKERQVERARQRMMIRLLINRVVQKRLSQLKVSPEELRRYYKGRWREFNRPERRRVKQIVFRVAKGASAKEWSEVELKARVLLPEIKEAAKTKGGFVKMVRQHSQDSSSRKREGDTGYSARTAEGGEWEKSFSQAVFSLKKVGQIAGPIRTSWGYHIVRLEEIVPALRQSFSQVRAQIEQRLLSQKKKRAYESYLQELRQKYKVHVNEKLLRKLEPSLGGKKRPAVQAQSPFPRRGKGLMRRPFPQRGKAPMRRPLRRKVWPATSPAARRQAPQRRVPRRVPPSR